MSFLWLQTLAFIGGSYVLFLIFDNTKISLHALRKQYPGDGKVHYTFELEDN